MVLENCGAGINHHERSISMHTAVTEHHMETEPSWNITELYVFWLITCVIFDFKQSPSSLYTINHHQYDNIYTSCKIAIIKWFTFTICCYHQLPLSLSSCFPLMRSARLTVLIFPAALEGTTSSRRSQRVNPSHTNTHAHLVWSVKVCFTITLWLFYSFQTERSNFFYYYFFYLFIFFFYSFHSKCWQLCLRTGRHSQGRGKS